MLYLIYGSNFLEASKKISEIKQAFFKKNPGFLLEEIDGDDHDTDNDFTRLIESQSLFSQKRLLIFKDTLCKIPNAEKFLTRYAGFLKASKDIFLFLEHGLDNGEILKIFQENSEKVQQVKEQKFVLSAESSNSIFKFVDRIFISSGVGSLLHLENAKASGIDAKNLINVIFWKLKKAPQKDKRVLNLAYETILADLNLKIDSKGWEENLSRLAISIASKV